jgi:hypothetical protein
MAEATGAGDYTGGNALGVAPPVAGVRACCVAICLDAVSRHDRRQGRPYPRLGAIVRAVAGAQPDQAALRISRGQVSVEGSSSYPSHDASIQKPELLIPKPRRIDPEARQDRRIETPARERLGDVRAGRPRLHEERPLERVHEPDLLDTRVGVAGQLLSRVEPGSLSEAISITRSAGPSSRWGPSRPGSPDRPR